MSKYGGESNAKKLARLALWKWLAKATAHEGGPIVILSGPHCYDARVAFACGVSPERIVAYDLEEDYVVQSRMEVGRLGVKVIHGNCLDRLTTGDFQAVFMDTCNTIAKIVPDTIGAIAAGVAKNPSVPRTICFGGMYGRDGMEGGELSRIQLITNEMQASAVRYNGIYIPGRAFSYTSFKFKGKGLSGSPMLYTTGTFVGASSRTVNRRARRAAKKLNRQLIDAAGADQIILRRFGSDHNGASVKREALRLSKDHDAQTVSDMLCISKGTVMAWKAHASMRRRKSWEENQKLPSLQ